MGEGTRDTAFLEALCLARGIGGYVFDQANGNKGFSARLEALSAQKGFSACKSILLVSDNDESSGKSFAMIKEQLNDIGFPSPPRALEIARKKDFPALGVLMLPYPAIRGSDSGCLETLLIPAMESANPTQAACVDQLMTCVNVPAWPKKGARDKVRVRCLISTVWHDDPMHGLQYCFAPEKNLIPLGHEIFDGVVEILANFQAWSLSDVKTWTEWQAAQSTIR